MKEIYLNEHNLLELFQGKDIYEDDSRVVIHPPKTHELIKVVSEDCGVKRQVADPDQLSPVKMILGEVYLSCKSMPCYTPNRLHGYCVMEGCEAVYNTIQRFGPIVGMQIVTEAVRRYQPGYDMDSLLEDVSKEIVDTI